MVARTGRAGEYVNTEKREGAVQDHNAHTSLTFGLRVGEVVNGPNHAAGHERRKRGETRGGRASTSEKWGCWCCREGRKERRAVRQGRCGTAPPPEEEEEERAVGRGDLGGRAPRGKLEVMEHRPANACGMWFVTYVPCVP